MALSKEKKQEIVSQYETWFKESQAIVLTQYTGLNMAEVDELRGKIREVGGEFHVMKNTLGKIAFSNAGLDAPEEYFVDSSALGLAFEDAPGVAKAIADFAKTHEVVQIKGGFLDNEHVTADEIKALAELPPLPVVRGQLLATIMSPASSLARLLNEPGRQMAQVLKAYADKGGAAEPAAEAAA
ncbi:MAG: 50S ribosomal protein L10 [Chloroflexi bacterium]|nr:MAG: 50S ribosomal protein L10 [Chloroflexota bacterium]MBL1196116.1 50S ribosomal protein L10 [Chloroflexota bacterium]NOH13409.1 50S ribosomal protein L10 [Chloroflexota bacterium]